MKGLYAVLASALCGCLCFAVLQVSNATCKALEAWRTAPILALRAAQMESEEYRRAALMVTSVALIHANYRAGQAVILADRTRNDLNHQLTQVHSEIEAFRADLKPVLENGAKGMEDYAAAARRIDEVVQRLDTAIAPHLDCRGNGNCWPSGITASLGGLKVALGETAQAARRVDAALPLIVRDATRFTDSSAAASEQTRQTMANLNAITKPLPKWLRIIAGVAPPVAQTGAASVGLAAAAGAFRK